jgi:sugar phosphate isomerase/epimerase
MRCGIDSYSYHRLLGGRREGEPAIARRMARGWEGPLAHARSLSVDALALQTMFLPEPDDIDGRAMRAAAGDLELILSWGGYEGLRLGADAGALAALQRWLAAAPELGASLVRIVVGGPRLRGLEPVADQIARTAPVVQRAAQTARNLGVALAVENHADLTVGELLGLLDGVGEDVGLCLDVANVMRLGEDPVAAVRAAGSRVRMVHLRDCDDPAGGDPVAGPCVRPYGGGVVPIDAVLDALGASGFKGPVCVELAQLGDGDDELELVAGCVAWLRDRLARLGSVAADRVVS